MYFNHLNMNTEYFQVPTCESAPWCPAGSTEQWNCTGQLKVSIRETLSICLSVCDSVGAADCSSLDLSPHEEKQSQASDWLHKFPAP